MNTAARADISAAARARIELLEAKGNLQPDLDNIAVYRRQLREDSADFVAERIAAFDGSIDMIDIAGVPCRQLTPAAWDSSRDAVVLYAFGGGYIAGSTCEDQVIALPLASLIPARIVMPEYRLAPEYPWPLPQQDIRAVYPDLLRVYGASRLAVCGESAGGNQAIGLLQHLRDGGLEMAACAAVLSPWIDLTHGGDSHDINGDRDPTLSTDWIEFAAAVFADGHPLDDPGVSPLFGDMHGLPPTMITSGSLDCLLSDCLRLARRLRDADVACDLRVWEGLWHVFEYHPIPEADVSLAEIATFIRRHSSA